MIKLLHGNIAKANRLISSYISKDINTDEGDNCMLDVLCSLRKIKIPRMRCSCYSYVCETCNIKKMKNKLTRSTESITRYLRTKANPDSSSDDLPKELHQSLGDTSTDSLESWPPGLQNLQFDHNSGNSSKSNLQGAILENTPSSILANVQFDHKYSIYSRTASLKNPPITGNDHFWFVPNNSDNSQAANLANDSLENNMPSSSNGHFQFDLNAMDSLLENLANISSEHFQSIPSTVNSLAANLANTASSFSNGPFQSIPKTVNSLAENPADVTLADPISFDEE